MRHRLGPEFLGSIELSVFVVKRVVALVLVIYVFLFFPSSSSSSSSVFNCSSSFSLIVLRTPLCFPRPFWFLIASKPRWLRPDGIHHFSYVEANLDPRPRPRKLRSALEGSKDPLDGSYSIGWMPRVEVTENSDHLNCPFFLFLEKMCFETA